jgi:hypothetical protein
MTLAGKPELLGQLRISNFRRNIWRPAVADANLACLRIRGLRHTAVALWIAAGASPKEVAARAGHTSMSFVLDRYGHLLPEADTALQARLDGLFAGRRNTDGTRRLEREHGALRLVASGARSWESGEVRRQGLEPRTVALRARNKRAPDLRRKLADGLLPGQCLTWIVRC